MAGRTRRRARERAVQCLYQWDTRPLPLDTLFDRFWRSQEEPVEVRKFAEHLVRGTIAAVEHIDPLLAHQLSNWKPERLSRVDRGILRLGVFELLNEPATPPAVVINEAIELARRFGGDEAAHFVNGVLDAVRRRMDEDSGEPTTAAADETSEAAGS